jgi:hypothetical protein
MDSRAARVYPRIVNASAVRQDAHAGGSPDGSVASPASSARAITIGGVRYPVLLPSIRDARLHVAAVTITVHILGPWVRAH